MAGRKRRIYFFEPIEFDQHDRPTSYTQSFWTNFHSHVKDLGNPADPEKNKRLRMEYLGRKYSGAARLEIAPAENYFYIAKARPGSDWPDVETADSQTTQLALADPSSRLVEPAYLLPVSGTPYVAALRTSGGPSWSAIENWISSVSGLATQDKRIELAPYVREDQLERLRAANGVSKLHLKVEPDAAGLGSIDGELAKALETVQHLGAGAVSVEIGLSFGRARPDERAAEDIARQVERLITNVKFKNASATIMAPSEDGKSFAKESVDFYKDRVTGTEYVGTNEDEAATPPVVLKAMSEAIRKFKKSLRT